MKGRVAWGPMFVCTEWHRVLGERVEMGGAERADGGDSGKSHNWHSRWWVVGNTDKRRVGALYYWDIVLWECGLFTSSTHFSRVWLLVCFASSVRNGIVPEFVLGHKSGLI